MKKVEIPKNECEGCASRDRMIQLLSDRVDELERLRDESADVMLKALGEWHESLERM